MPTINPNNGITWFPTSRELKPSSVWANMPGKGADRDFEPSLAEIRQIAKYTGNPKRVSREDIEAYRHQTPMSDTRASAVMQGYQRAATSKTNMLQAAGKHIASWARTVGQLFGVLFGGYTPGSG